jgi:hypothetical protein
MRRGSDDKFPKQQLVTEQFRRETNEDGDAFFSHPSLRHLVFEPGERLIKFEQAGGSSASSQSEQRGKGWCGFEEIIPRRSKARPRSFPSGGGHQRICGEALIQPRAKFQRATQ